MKYLQQMAEAWTAHGISYALGGSGLLLSLNLLEEVNDWDVTTDCPLEQLVRSLQPLRVELKTSGDYPFASDYRVQVITYGKPVEIIGGFKLHAENGIVKLPTVPAQKWNGIHLGSPEVWAAAYALMKRPAKAEKLLQYLRLNGADASIIKQLCAEPIPDSLKQTLQQLPCR